MIKRPLRVGFDLDGVLLYNPARIARYPVKIIKKLLHKKTTTFYIPKKPYEKFLWRILHFSSLFLSPGYKTIKRLADEGLIEPYLVTARYKFLESDFQWWLRHMPIKTIFKGIYINEHNEQPHLYKEKKMKSLKLDIFIEDNYDIVEHLSHTTTTKVLWIYNIIDRNTQYPYKFGNLKEALTYLQNHILKKKVQQRKFLLFSEYFPPHWTGIAKAFHQLATDLATHGYTTTVITTQFDTTLPQSEKTEQNIVIERIPYSFRLSRTHYSPKTLVRAWSILRDNDHIIINSPHSNIFFLAILTKLFGKKLSIFHQGDLKLPRKTGTIALHIMFERIFDFMTLPAALLADTISTYTYDYAEHSRVLRYFLYKFMAYIPKTRISLASPSPKFKKRLDELKKGNMVVGFAGRFVEEKGFDILLDAIPKVLQKKPNTVFLFAGASNLDYEPFYQTLTQKVKQQHDTFILLGLLKEHDLAYFHKNNDVFVTSSRSDCFPLTQMEAVDAGTPLVVTDIPGARMIVKSSKCGLIVPAENADSLAEAIIRVMNAPEKYKQHIPAAKAFLKRYEKPPYY